MYNLNYVRDTHGGVLILVKLQAEEKATNIAICIARSILSFLKTRRKIVVQNPKDFQNILGKPG